MEELYFSFFKGKKILITGHTGFKGSWLCAILHEMGADVTGYSLPAQGEDALYHVAHIENKVNSIEGDIRCLAQLQQAFAKNSPEIVIHMAAQPLVRESYASPVYTYETNVMGTVNVLECIRQTPSVKSFVNVTTDKVYENVEKNEAYIETDRLDGYDPYSNSKSCSELVTHCYTRSFLREQGIAVSTCRAGNVIGGGDCAKDRIIPDCVRAAKKGQPIQVRNAASIRPYQHVLEPLFVYLMIAMEQYKDESKAGNYNVGPQMEDCLRTGELVDLFCEVWGDGLLWEDKKEAGPHEAGILMLDTLKLKETFGWKQVWNTKEAIKKVVEWEKVYAGKDSGDATNSMSSINAIEEVMQRQITEYRKLWELKDIDSDK